MLGMKKIWQIESENTSRKGATEEGPGFNAIEFALQLF